MQCLNQKVVNNFNMLQFLNSSSARKKIKCIIFNNDLLKIFRNSSIRSSSLFSTNLIDYFPRFGHTFVMKNTCYGNFVSTLNHQVSLCLLYISLCKNWAGRNCWQLERRAEQQAFGIAKDGICGHSTTGLKLMASEN